MLSIFTLFIIGISLFGFKRLPVFDFRPYSIGSYIPEKMEIPEGAPQDEYESIMIYEKNGVQQEFSVENYPWQDTSWIFVDAKHILLKKGYEPPIHDFSIETIDGEDITDMVLFDESYTFLLIAYDLNKSVITYKTANKINKLAEYASENGYRFIGLTSSLNDIVEASIKKYSFNFEFCNTDEITLKTIIRSNPGIVLLKEGIILNKWHYNDIPEFSISENNILSGSISQLNSIANKNKRNALYLFAIIAILGITALKLKYNNL
jgi:hypothetical protein